MVKCDLCGRNEEGLSVLDANHKELGHIWVCRECWVRLYEENRMVSGSTGSGGTCPTCG